MLQAYSSVSVSPQYSIPMKVERLPHFQGFEKGSDHAGAIDLKSTKDVILNPGERYKMPLGFKIQLPTDWHALIIPRSGLGSQGLVISNLIGLIDCIPLHSKILCADKVSRSLEEVIEQGTVDIVSFNESSGEYEEDSIKEVWSVGVKPIIEIQFDDGSVVECTETQLVLTVESQWVMAKDLKETDTVLSIS